MPVSSQRQQPGWFLSALAVSPAGAGGDRDVLGCNRSFRKAPNAGLKNSQGL